MQDKEEIEFRELRDLTFDSVIEVLNTHISETPATLLLSPHEISESSMKQNAKRESFSLFLQSVSHLKSGAPDNRMGLMTTAASKASLRSSSLAASIGVTPPEFEQIYFSIDYKNGYEAAVFFCDKLFNVAEGDFQTSKSVIYKKISDDKADDILKKQIAFSFNVLSETYLSICNELKYRLKYIEPPIDPKPSSQPNKAPHR